MLINPKYALAVPASDTGKTQFPGVYSAISGLRYYTPSTGRWLSRDALGERGGVNQYGFIHNEPISKMDLLGLVEWGPAAPPGNIIGETLTRKEFYKIINRGYGKVAPSYVTENLDRGCVGVCSLYTGNYGPGWRDYPEERAGTKCFATYAQAEAFKCTDCETKLMLFVERYEDTDPWLRPVTADSNGLIYDSDSGLESPILKDGGTYNYVPRIPGTDLWVETNVGVQRREDLGDPEDPKLWKPLARLRQRFKFTKQRPDDVDINSKGHAGMFCVKCVKKE